MGLRSAVGRVADSSGSAAVTGLAVTGLVAAGLFVAVLAVQPRPVSAHTDVESVVPADGSVVEEPVDEVVIVFNQTVTPTASGFELLTESGDLIVPRVFTDDFRRHVLSLDPPLTSGDVAVRYEVRAEDGHTIAGGFRFVVDGSAVSVPSSVPSDGVHGEMDGMEMPAGVEHSTAADGRSVTATGAALTDLPVAVYPTMGVAALGGVVIAARVRARKPG